MSWRNESHGPRSLGKYVIFGHFKALPERGVFCYTAMKTKTGRNHADQCSEVREGASRNTRQAQRTHTEPGRSCEEGTALRSRAPCHISHDRKVLPIRS